MADEYDVAAERDKLLKQWNPPAEDHGLERLVGVPTEDGAVAATAHVPMEELNRPLAASSDQVDAQRMGAYDDDLSGDGGQSYEDMSNDELRDELGRRDLPKSGNKKEMVARLEEDDSSDDEDDSEDDD